MKWRCRSALGQTEKNSVQAHVIRFAPRTRTLLDEGGTSRLRQPATQGVAVYLATAVPRIPVGTMSRANIFSEVMPGRWSDRPRERRRRSQSEIMVRPRLHQSSGQPASPLTRYIQSLVSSTRALHA